MKHIIIFLALVGSGTPLLFAQTPSPQWNPDYDGNGAITILDVLGVLSVFEEVDSDGDGVWDTNDPCVGALDVCGICNGTGSDNDSDGVCDTVDDCVGSFDACGVCNGDGPNFLQFVDIVVQLDSTFNETYSNWEVFVTSTDSIFALVCAIEGCTDPTALTFNPEANVSVPELCEFNACGGVSTISYQGVVYPVLEVGNNCWFGTNLRALNYLNGDPIPHVQNNSLWTQQISGARSYPNGDPLLVADYGMLYNGHVVKDLRGVCPAEWHVSTDSDWNSLVSSNGGNANAAPSLKSSPSDLPSWNGTNSSGFSGLPAGSRLNYNGEYHIFGTFGNWWTSTLGTTNLFARSMGSTHSNVYKSESYIELGFSIRCVKD